MAVIKLKPTSAGARFVSRVGRKELHKGQPHMPLVKKLPAAGGRNNLGRVTVRHMGGGHKRLYRVIDFRRDKIGVPGVVERLEYDPNRSARIALVLYRDGERRYIIAPRGMEAGQEILCSPDAPIRPGNCLPLRNIPVGTVLHCLELKPGRGAQLARSAGAAVQLVGKEESYAIVRLRSGEMRRVHLDCKAAVGEVGNSEHSLASLGKAGAARWRGRRPTVRGTAMNPVDHPHGGGEGRNFGKHPVTPWGVPTKGYKTRNQKRTDGMIIRRRK